MTPLASIPLLFQHLYGLNRLGELIIRMYDRVDIGGRYIGVTISGGDVTIEVQGKDLDAVLLELEEKLIQRAIGGIAAQTKALISVLGAKTVATFVHEPMTRHFLQLVQDESSVPRQIKEAGFVSREVNRIYEGK